MNRFLVVAGLLASALQGASAECWAPTGTSDADCAVCSFYNGQACFEHGGVTLCQPSKKECCEMGNGVDYEKYCQAEFPRSSDCYATAGHWNADCVKCSLVDAYSQQCISEGYTPCKSSMAECCAQGNASCSKAPATPTPKPTPKPTTRPTTTTTPKPTTRATTKAPVAPPEGPAPTSPAGRRQVACVADALTTARSSGSKFGWANDCTSSVEDAVDKCRQKGFSHVALGGVWEKSPWKTTHNQFVCTNGVPSSTVAVTKCDQPCPGDSFYKKNEGLCGGGCGNCPNFPAWESDCVGDSNEPCGKYWSVYETA